METSTSFTAVVTCNDPAQVESLSRGLENEGLRVLSCSSAEAALGALSDRTAPKVIVTDLRLPGIDGWRFCRLLRSPEYAALNEVPLLVVSSTYTGVDVERTTADLGANAFLELPCAREVLRATVRDLLDGRTGRRSATVLVVEDDQSQSAILRVQFTLRGHTTHVAQSADEARALHAQHAPAIAIIDQYLPDPLGGELLQEFKEANPQIVVIMVTGHPSPELALDLMRTGADGYVAKPFDFDYLYDLCEKAQRERHLLRAEALLDERTRELRESQEHLTALHEVSNELSAARSLDDLCRRAVELGRSRLGFDRLGIWFVRDEPDRISGSFGTDEQGQLRDERGHLVAVSPDSPVGQILTNTKRSDLYPDTPLLNHAGEVVGRGSQALAALWDGQNIIGCIAADNLLEDRPLTERHLELLTLYASTLGHLCSRKRAEEALASERERLATTLRSMGESVFVADGSGRLIVLNAAAEQLTGWPATDTVAKTLGDLAAFLGATSGDQLLASPTDGPTRELTKEGVPRQVFELRANPIAEGSEPGGWVLLVREVTEERQVRQQLEQQGRLAAVGQLAAGIAHDFNNLLTGVVGFAELLRLQEDMPESAKGRLLAIEEQGHRAAELIRQILDFSRRSLIQLRPLNLVSLLKETGKLLERTIEERVKLVLEIEPVSHMVNADVAQFQQILTNLAVNARDAMPAGGELRIRLARHEFALGDPRPFPGMPDGEYVLLVVSDTGVGIPPEITEHIFEPFFTTKGVGEGTGLGLAQVYGIVKQHRGYIDVESQLGQGTTFTIYLPAVAANEEFHGLAAGPAPSGKRETILVVEDEPQVLDVLRAMLESLNYRVLTAGNGRQALATHAQHADEIALVLTDMTMPELGGIELFRALQRQDPTVKVVVISGYPLGENTDALLEQGLTGWIQKPPTLGVLAEAVSRALEGPGA